MMSGGWCSRNTFDEVIITNCQTRMIRLQMRYSRTPAQVAAAAIPTETPLDWDSRVAVTSPIVTTSAESKRKQMPGNLTGPPSRTRSASGQSPVHEMLQNKILPQISDMIGYRLHGLLILFNS